MDDQSRIASVQRPPVKWATARLMAVLLVVLMVRGRLAAQSCAMCYTSVAGGGKGVIHAMQVGIVVLLIPPVLLFAGLIWIVVRWKTIPAKVAFSPET
jgi:hypothetical protein